MAVAYTTYKSEAKIPFHYHFVCEHCGKDSGMLSAQVLGIADINISGKGRPSLDQQMELQTRAQASAKAALQAKINGAEKGRYGEGVSSKCPNCGKIQSWELRSGRWKPLINALQGLLAGFLIMIFASIFGKEAGSATVICMPIGLGIGLIFGLIQRTRAKIDSTKTTTRNKPEFIWPNIQA